MAKQYHCPDADVLRRLLLGQLPGPTAEGFARHLEQCPCCSLTVQTLEVKDPLIESVRSQAFLESGSDAEIISRLMDRLQREGPPSPNAGSTLPNA